MIEHEENIDETAFRKLPSKKDQNWKILIGVTILSVLLVIGFFFSDEVKKIYIRGVFNMPRCLVREFLVNNIEKNAGGTFFIPMLELYENNRYGSAHFTSILYGLSQRNIHPDRIKYLGQYIKKPRAKGRVIALRFLSQVPEAGPDVVSIIQDHDPQIRCAAITCLGDMHYTEAVPSIIPALNDKDNDVRFAAIMALQKLKDKKAVPHLLLKLADGNSNNRCAAIQALASFKDPTAIEPIIALLADPKVEIRYSAVRSLSSFKDPRIINSLLVALQDKEAGVKRAVIRTLGEIKDTQSIDILSNLAINGKDVDIQKEAIETLSASGDPRAVRIIITALKDREERVRSSAIYALRNLKSPLAVEHLISLIKRDTGTSIRSDAIRVLGEFGDLRAAEPMIVLLKDTDTHVRIEAIHVLITLHDPRAVEPLIALLKDQNVQIRIEAIIALGELKNSRAVVPLITSLQDGDILARNSAVSALRKLKDSRSVAPLLDLLENEQEDSVRANIIVTLGKLGDSRALTPLQKIAENPDERKRIRKKAGEAIEELKKQKKPAQPVP